MANSFNGILRLRRDNDYNYARIENTFIPANGEVCLVDTSDGKLRAKVGNGTTIFANLPYTDSGVINEIHEVVVRGYYYGGVFYKDSAHIEVIEASESRIYIDISTCRIYSYNGTAYVIVGGNEVATATASVAGILKLYDTVGQNTDGTMTQKAITDELDDKIEMDIDMANEMLILGNDLF